MSSKYGFESRDEIRRRTMSAEEAAARKREAETVNRIEGTVSDILTDYAKTQGSRDPNFLYDAATKSFREGSYFYRRDAKDVKVELTGGDEPQLRVKQEEWSGQGVAAAKALSKKTGLPVEVTETYTEKRVYYDRMLAGAMTNPKTFTETKTRVRKFHPDGTETSSED